MELFSSVGSSEKNSASRPIPKEVFEAVRVMGAEPRRTTPMNGIQKQGTSSKGESPFLGTSSFSPSPVSSVPQTQRASLPSLPSQKSLPPAQEERKRKILIMFAFGGVLFLMIVGLVAWYFLRKTAVSPEPLLESSSEVTMVAEPVPVLPVAPFAPDTTNFLMVDTETVTTPSFLALLTESGAKISAAQMSKPVEFLLTDKNNNPLAFSRFAYLTDLSLPEDLIAALGETFSIFLYNTDGKITMGLSFAPFASGDMGTVRELVTKNEASLPFLFRPLLFPGLTVPTKASFRSGVYNTEAVRYVNVEAAQGISFDYVMRDKEWIIGTSKDTLRAIIDKKSQP